MRLAIAAGVLDTVSNVAMLFALQASMLSLASVLISLYPAATVAPAMVVLKERVRRWHPRRRIQLVHQLGQRRQ